MSLCFSIADNFLSSNNSETAASLNRQTMLRQWLLTQEEFFSELKILCTSFATQFWEFNVEQKRIAAEEQNLAIVISFTISIIYHTVSSTIWPNFSSFIFCRPISRALRRAKQYENVGNEENIGHIVWVKRVITSLSLTYIISNIC